MSRTFSGRVLAASKDPAPQRPLREIEHYGDRLVVKREGWPRAPSLIAVMRRGSCAAYPHGLVAKLLAKDDDAIQLNPHLAGDIGPAILFPLPTRRLDISDLAPYRVVTDRTIRRHGGAHLAAAARKKFLDGCHAVRGVGQLWANGRWCTVDAPLTKASSICLASKVRS